MIVPRFMTPFFNTWSADGNTPAWLCVALGARDRDRRRLIPSSSWEGGRRLFLTNGHLGVY